MDSQCKYAAIARGDASVYLRLPTRADYRERIWVSFSFLFFLFLSLQFSTFFSLLSGSRQRLPFGSGGRRQSGRCEWGPPELWPWTLP